MQHAEDIVQETFVILWEKRHRIKTKNLKSYLYTIANNLFIDQQRHAEVVLKFQRKVPEFSESPEYLMEIEEFDKKLQSAIATLPDNEKTVFLMNRIDDLTFKEIAESLNLSIKAVEKRMHNAVNKLYMKLNHKL